jgi:hypothetical protein
MKLVMKNPKILRKRNSNISLLHVKEDILQVGAKLQFSLEIESREYNGKWYTDVKAWKVEGDSQNSSAGIIGDPVFKQDDNIPGDSEMPF